MGNENTIEAVNSSSLRANIQCAIFQPLTQHVSITRNNIKTNIHLQTSRSLNRIKQDMLLVPKTIHAQHCTSTYSVHTLNTKRIHSNINSVNSFTKETGSNKVKLPKVGANVIVPVPCGGQGATKGVTSSSIENFVRRT
jgi:hypothetical protein